MDGREISTQASWILLACLLICCFDEKVMYRCFVFIGIFCASVIISNRLLFVCIMRVDSYQG